jgi:dienelactone hydrolase
MTNASGAFSISGYVFTFKVWVFGNDTSPIISLTEGSGIANGGTAGTLIIDITESQSNIASNYYIMALDCTYPDGTTRTWINGLFIVNADVYSGDVTNPATITLSAPSTPTTLSIAPYVGSGSANYPEYPSATLINGTVQYTSSLDPTLIGLNYNYYYPSGVTNLPILIAFHAYEDQASSFDTASLQRWARLGYLVIIPEMRGSVGNYTAYGGSRDAGGREVDDAYDAYQHAKTFFSGLVSDNGQRVSVIGFSAGGGDAYNLACRYPDTFQHITVMFGISDYGTDATYGWYNQQAPRQASLQTYIGGTPAAKPQEYAARYSKNAIATNYQGYLAIFHDTADASVGVDHSQRVVAMYTAASRTDYYYNESTVGSTYRWSHGYPGTFSDLTQAEQYWKDKPKTQSIKTIATSGTLKINGKIQTKRFTVNLNDGDWRNMGRCRTADLTYDYSANSYVVSNLQSGSVVTVTTDTGLIAVAVSQGATLTLNPASPLVAGYKPSNRLNVNTVRLLKDGSNNVTVLADAVGGHKAQGFSFTAPGTAPVYSATELNSLPGLTFNGTTQYLQGLGVIEALRNKQGFTMFTVSKCPIFSQGSGATNLTQVLTYVAGSIYCVVANGTSSNENYTGTQTYLVRTVVVDTKQTSNTNRVQVRENKVAKTLTITGTTDTISTDSTSDLVTIGKRCYDSSFFGGNWVDAIIFDWPMNATQYGAVEDYLKTLYAI